VHARILNGIGHFDIAGPDIDRLGDFYSAVLGWSSQPRGPGYSQVSTPTGQGALVEASEASFVVGIVVEDLDTALAKAVSAGGLVTMPRTDNGWVSKGQVTDPAGNLLTLIQA
jgi:predicted enzyme related to lactoylglutathione lyase